MNDMMNEAKEAALTPERTLSISTGAALPTWIKYLKARSLLTCGSNNPPNLNFSSTSKLQWRLARIPPSLVARADEVIE